MVLVSLLCVFGIAGVAVLVAGCLLDSDFDPDKEERDALHR